MTDWTDDMPKEQIVQILREKEAALAATEKALLGTGNLRADLSRWLATLGYNVRFADLDWHIDSFDSSRDIGVLTAGIDRPGDQGWRLGMARKRADDEEARRQALFNTPFGAHPAFGNQEATDAK